MADRPDRALAWLETYAHLVAADIRGRAQYRLSFGMDFLASFVGAGTDFVAILVLFAHLPRLGGWSLAEVSFLYGLAGICFALTDMLVGHLDKFGETIRTGRFDVLLVRPWGSLFQVVASEFQVRRLGKLLQAAAVLVYAIGHLHIAWSPVRALVLVSSLASGTSIFTGVWVAGAAASFWTTDAREVVNSFTYGGNFLASFPISIFGSWLRRLLAFVVPMAFVAYYPSLLILGKPDSVAGQPWLGLLSAPVGLATLAAGRAVWQAGVRRYRSTGS